MTKAGQEDTDGDSEPDMQNHSFDDVNEGSVNAYGTDAGDDQSPSSPCPADADGVKYEWDEDADSFETSE